MSAKKSAAPLTESQRLGRVVEAYCKHNGQVIYTMVEFAKLAKMDRNTLGQMLSGGYAANPRPSTINRIAKATGYTAGDITHMMSVAEDQKQLVKLIKETPRNAGVTRFDEAAEELGLSTRDAAARLFEFVASLPTKDIVAILKAPKNKSGGSSVIQGLKYLAGRD